MEKTPTSELRYLRRGNTRVLQQKWSPYWGDPYWEDVPEVVEEDDCLTLEQIEELRPTFKFGSDGMEMVEWFEIHGCYDKGFCIIKSGLKHADGETKSPFHYDFFKGGDKSTEEVLEHFNEWWKTVKHLDTSNEG